MAVAEAQLARDLREVIAALDRRLPRLEQAGEASIARDAAALRAKAVKRLADLAGRKAPDPVDAADRPSHGERGEAE
jgi:hypothetical protein